MSASDKRASTAPALTAHPIFPQKPWRAAVLAALLALAVGGLIEHFAQRFVHERERISAYEYMSAARARLEGVINANLLLVHGLSAVVSAHPDIDQSEFSRIARGLVDGRHAVRNIAGAPDMVIRLMYPLEGNSAALGMDYRTHPTQRVAALRAMQSGQPVLAGPLTLEQGGAAIVVREPVYLPPGSADAPRRFWGLIAAVIDLDLLYRLANIADPDPAWRLALRGTDGTGASGPVFFGSPAVFADSPVTADVLLPSGTWQIAAMPAAGWGHTDDIIWMIRLMAALSALTAGWLTYRVSAGARAQSITTARLRSLLATIPDAIWMKAPDGTYLSCNRRFEDFFGATEQAICGKTDYDFVAAPLADFFRENDRTAILADKPTLNEEWVTFASDRRHRLLETIKTPVHDESGLLLGVLGIARDITDHRQAQQRIQSLNRIYAVLSGINECIVRLRSPDELFREACRIAVEIGGFEMAWIGMIDGASQSIRAQASAGKVDGYLDLLQASAERNEFGMGPTGMAWRLGCHVVCDDIATDPRMELWREAALRRGFRSSVGLPIRVGDEIRGVFTLYAGQPDFFVEDELRLLDELALDIGFSLEYMQAQADLRQQRDTLKRTSELAQVAGWELDAHTMTGNCTDEMAHIFGLPTGVPIRLAQALSCMDGPTRAHCEQAIATAINSGVPFDIEHEITTFAGIRKWIRTQGVPVRDGEVVVRIEGATQDITRHRHAEAMARQSDAVLSSVFQVLPDLFFLLDDDGTVRDFRSRPGVARYLPPQQLIGRKWEEALPPGAAAQLIDARQRARASDELASCEYNLDLGNGECRFEARLSRLAPGGQIIAVVRDVTERYRSHIALAESELRYRRLFMKNPAPMAIYDTHSQYLLAANEAFLGHYGYTAQEATALRIGELHPEGEREQINELIPRLSGLTHEGDWHHVKRDGTIINVEIHSHDLDYQGRPARLGVINDITERKQMEHEIRQFNAVLEARVQTRTAELAAANKELETFTYSVSHDLKAPLRGIDGYSLLLSEDHASVLGPDGALFLANIRQGVRQMGQLIEDLLTYSRTDRRTLLETELDLVRELDAVLALRRADLDARGVVLDIRLASTRVRADPEGLRMVLGNLIDNAVKFAKKGQAPEIEITSTATATTHVISIRDNGIGFDMQFHDRIFDIFQRLQRSEDYPGTGIGLAIVRKAMQRMGGRVWADSTPGYGAIFYLELPRS